jgi:hypothetical protein
MKQIFTLVILAAIFAFGTANAQTASLKTITPNMTKQTATVKVEKANKSVMNILIHSIAFQRYNRVKYTLIPAENLSVKKMQDTPDNLMPMNENNTADYYSVTTACTGK